MLTPRARAYYYFILLSLETLLSGLNMKMYRSNLSGYSSKYNSNHKRDYRVNKVELIVL